MPQSGLHGRDDEQHRRRRVLVVTVPRQRTLGLLAICGAILCFSISSSIVKLAETPGSVIAFWRMLATVFVWQGALWIQGKRTTLAQLRRVLIPGILFGANLAMFFTAVTRTSIAHAEFIGSLTPVILVPAGALLFGESLRWKAMGWGLVALVGIAIVLFSSPPKGTATLAGDLMVVAAMFLWAGYLLSTKRVRQGMDVVEFMAAVVPIATLTLIPIVLVRGGVGDVSSRGWWAIAVLTILTGTMAHGFIVFAQHSIPIGTIGMMQVAQPALAVMWAALLLDEDLRGMQVVGMALVLVGLALFTYTSQRSAPPIDVVEPLEPFDGTFDGPGTAPARPEG
jgi:drug/metabolite transporter (DMT)-like permease